MKKDNFRDYSMDAFRFYALCGRPTIAAIKKAQKELPSKCRASLDDLESVAKLIERIYFTEPDEGEIWVKVLDKVFFCSPTRVPSRGELTGRIRDILPEIGISESTAYRIIRKVRDMYAQERGLRRGEVNYEEIRKALSQK